MLVGQAFHWFDPATAPAEIARVLRPGGVVAGLWNAEDNDVDWVAAMGPVARASIGDADERAAVLARVSDYLRTLHGSAEFDFPMRTHVVRATRR